MNDLDDVPIKELITQAIEKCQDTNLLDLVYKLLICETESGSNR